MKQAWKLPKGKQVRITNKDSRYYGHIGIIIDRKLKFPDVEFEYLIELEYGTRRWFKNIEVKLMGNITIVDGRIIFPPDTEDDH